MYARGTIVIADYECIDAAAGPAPTMQTSASGPGACATTRLIGGPHKNRSRAPRLSRRSPDRLAGTFVARWRGDKPVVILRVGFAGLEPATRLSETLSGRRVGLIAYR
jgi:hypothetical protein